MLIAKIFIIFRLSSLLDRSRSNLAQLANLGRTHRVKAAVKRHVDVVGQVVADFGSLPFCLRDDYLVRAVDRAVDNSLALYQRVEAWTFEEDEIMEAEVVQSAEEYLRRCSSVLEDVLEGIRALRALAPEEEKEERDDEEDEEKVDEQEEQQEGGEMDEDEEQDSDEEMTEDEEEEDDSE